MLVNVLLTTETLLANALAPTTTLLETVNALPGPVIVDIPLVAVFAWNTALLETIRPLPGPFANSNPPIFAVPYAIILNPVLPA